MQQTGEEKDPCYCWEGLFHYKPGSCGEDQLTAHTRKLWAALASLTGNLPVVLSGLLLSSLRAPGCPGPSWVLLHREAAAQGGCMEPSRRPLPPPSFIPLPHRCPGPPPHLCGSRPSGPACPGGCFYTALPPAVGDEETDNEKLRGGQGGGRGQPRLSPDPRTVSHQPSSQGSLLPSQTAHRSRGLPYPRKHPGHTQRTHGTHGIDTGTRHRLSNTDQARDLTCALPDSAQLGPWA